MDSINAFFAFKLLNKLLFLYELIEEPLKRKENKQLNQLKYY